MLETDYRDFLKQQLEFRTQKNSRYGLRAFSRDLKVAPQNLSRVLMKKKNFSIATALKFSSRLQLEGESRQHYFNLVRYTLANDTEALSFLKERSKALKRQINYQQISEAKFQAISEWYHAALLELVTLKGFQSDIDWISEKLRISKAQTQEAIERLIGLSLLQRHSSGKLSRTEKGLFSDSTAPSKAIQRFHLQMMRKAVRSMRTDPVKRRFMGTLLVPVSANAIEESIRKIESFIKSMNESLEEDPHEEIYGLAVQLFPVVQIDSK